MKARAIAASPVRMFVCLALALGTVFVLVTPAFTGYDEPLHYLRAWQLSDGHLRGDQRLNDVGRVDLGDNFPAGLAPDVVVLLRDGLYKGTGTSCHRGSAICAVRHIADAPPKGRPTFIGFPSAAVYPPVPYAPATVAIRIARTVGLSTLATLWLARFANLFSYVLLVAFAITRMPRYRTLLAVLALAPVCVFQAAMVSADGITIALALVAIAIALQSWTFPVGTLTNRSAVEAGAITAALGFSKPPYILFCVLFLPTIVRHRRQVAGKLVAVALVPGLAMFAYWSHYAQAAYIPPSNPFFGAFANPGYAYHDIDATKQLTGVLHSPFSFIGAIGTTIARTWLSLLHDAVSQISGWAAPSVVATIIATATYAAVALTLAMRGPTPDLVDHDARERDDDDAEPAVTASGGWFGLVTAAIVAVGLFAALFLLAYTGWNAVDAPRIDAFQGRYLFPVLALGVLGCGAPIVARMRSSGPPPAPGRFVAALPWALVALGSCISAVGLLVHYY